MDSSFHVEERTFFRKIDLNFILVIFALNVIGLINLYSATHGPNSKEVENLFIQQIVWLTAGWTIFFVITVLDYNIVSRLAYFVYALNFLAILFVTFYGKVALGAQRWIDLGFFRYQPSETMKLAMIMLLAKVLSTRNSLGGGMGLKELLFPLILILVPFVLIVEQPDLGTALMIIAISGSMIIFSKVKKIIEVTAFAVVAVALPLAWKFALRDYQKNRVLTFFLPVK